MVVLLVVQRKVLGSVCAESGVDSVGEDICSALSHIRANFPGAHASQRADLLTLSSGRGWCWGRGGGEGKDQGGSEQCRWHSG